MPESYLPLYPDKDSIGCGEGLRDERLAPFPRTHYAVQVNRREYNAIISHLDTQIGRIIDALQQSGKADNTYIFYSADHGLAVGHHGLIGKQNMYEHSMKPPLIVIGPDLPKNKKNAGLVYLQDIMASTLELAGVSPPDYVEFKLPNGELAMMIHGDQINGGAKNVDKWLVEHNNSFREGKKPIKTIFVGHYHKYSTSINKGTRDNVILMPSTKPHTHTNRFEIENNLKSICGFLVIEYDNDGNQMIKFVKDK